MKKLKLLILLFIPVSLMSVTVNQKELKTVEPVEFEDYEGPNKSDDKPEEVVGIGRSLQQGLNEEGKFTWNNKYTIIRAIDPKSEKLNADIFIIEKYAKVDTIKNVRRILSGYLQEEYGYSQAEADILAKFITYYNAVYRSKMDYFKEKYSEKVLSNLAENSVGISISYKDWPGKTRIVIPLSKDDKDLDTTDLTDDKVIESLRKTEDDRGVSDRKEIVEIKKEKVEEKKKEVEKKKEEVKKKEAEIKTKEKEIEKKKEKAETIEDPVKKEEAKKEIKKEEAAVKKEKADLEKKKEEVKKETKTIAKKEAEIKKDETGIKKDEELNKLKKNPDLAIEKLEETEKELETTKKELTREKENIMDGKLYYLKVKEWEKDGHYNNDMVIIDAKTRKVVVVSPVKRIDCDKYLINEKGVVVIIHNEDKPSEHSLVLLDKNNLTLIKKGDDNVFWRSFIEDRDGFIYVIITKPDGFYLGRFTYNLELDKISTVQLDKDSFISFFEDTIYINRSDKTIVVLNKKDLSFVDAIKP